MSGNGMGAATRLTVVGAYLRLTITDTPSNASVGQFAASSISQATRTVWYHVPTDWVTDGVLRPCRRKILLDGLYGPWSTPGEDRRTGPRYVVLSVQERLLSESEARDRPWLDDLAAFCRYGADGSHHTVTPAEL